MVSALGRFEVTYSTACVPYTLTVHKIGNFSPEPQYVYEGDLATTPERLDTTYTYTQPGTYTIYQIINNPPPGESTLDSLTVEFFEPVVPDFEYFYCDNTTIVINITDINYDFYTISTDSTIDTVSQDSHTEITLIQDTANEINIQGYIMDAFPNCGISVATITPAPVAYDFTLEDLHTTYICDNELALDLDFTANENTVYRISYFNESFSDVLFEGILDTGRLHFEPVSLPNPQASICIQVDALQPCTGQVIEGNRVCEDLPQNFTAIDLAYASYEGEDIRIFFENNENGIVSLEKRTEDFLIKRWDSLTTGFLDESISPIRRYDYTLIFIPSCGADTQRIELTPPFITAEQLKPNSYNISWSEGQEIIDTPPLLELSTYNVVDSSNVISVRDPSIPQRINLSYENGDRQAIVLEQVYSDLGLIIRSNPLIYDYEYIVHVPRAFTPNDDGLNDRLEVFGLPSEEFRMLIYNKWGELVYICESTEEFWDGGGKNQKTDHGVYTYYIEFENQEGEVYSQRGSFLLLKN